MDSRREFLKKAGLLASAGMLPPSIQRAFAINPETGTTFLDAEHIVILMQENRSFDHAYGMLQGVRGFNDRRAMRMPNGNSVWLQGNNKGETFVPFRLDITGTNATWMGSLPHGWTDQTDARNKGAMDRWLESKKSGHSEFKDLPLTMGFYNRQDLAFYYSLADAFTICDQNFCSSLTGTTSNRIYLWTGTNRDSPTSVARVRNEETDYDSEARWTTFPERLEDNGISWKIYQNELSVGVGFKGEEDAWLGNFTDNPIEFFEQFHVRFHKEYLAWLPDRIKSLESEIQAIEEKIKSQTPGTDETAKMSRRLDEARLELTTSRADIEKYTQAGYQNIPQREKNLHEKAFVTNRNDPDYHQLTDLKYNDRGVPREMKVPKGDTLYQFRKDVKEGALPTVSWLVAPENFSDHPGAPWYGAWYISEALDILTQNPEIWKKTIFILCYDENDGYFDHVPPFVAPVPGDMSSGKTSAGIDTTSEYLSLQDDLKRKGPTGARGGPVGLGYRVPLVVVSPWSRGGAVCSQVFDHTSIIMFLEKFLSKRTGKKIFEPNISEWRRAVCGDLTSVFTPFNGEKVSLPTFLARDQFVEGIHKAKFRKIPERPNSLTSRDIEAVNARMKGNALPVQEKGTRISRALPYELQADGWLSDDRRWFEIRMSSSNKSFGANASGAPFQVHWIAGGFATRDYAVTAGDTVTDSWNENTFSNGEYHARLHGPNGFYREFRGDGRSTVRITAVAEQKNGKLTGSLLMSIRNTGAQTVEVALLDRSYNAAPQSRKIPGMTSADVIVDLHASSGWYDISVTASGMNFEHRYAGRIEVGRDSITDPAMA